MHPHQVMGEPAAKKQRTDGQKPAEARADGRKARIAVVGAGWWSQGWHLPHLQRNPNSEITAIIEPCAAPRSTLNPDMKTTKELGEIYGVPTFARVEDFLASDVAAKRSRR